MTPPLDFHWRTETPRTVGGTAFALRVAEMRAMPFGPHGGYMYAVIALEDGYELLRTFIGWDGVPFTYGQTADPAAAANPAAITVPAGKRWKLHLLFEAYVADANVANRYCTGSITDGTDTIERFQILPPITANATAYVEFFNSAYVTTSLQTTNYGTGMFPIELNAGSVISLVYSNKQAGDDAGPLFYLYQEVDA